MCVCVCMGVCVCTQQATAHSLHSVYSIPLSLVVTTHSPPSASQCSWVLPSGGWRLEGGLACTSTKLTVHCVCPLPSSIHTTTTSTSLLTYHNSVPHPMACKEMNLVRKGSFPKYSRLLNDTHDSRTLAHVFVESFANSTPQALAVSPTHSFNLYLSVPPSCSRWKGRGAPPALPVLAAQWTMTHTPRPWSSRAFRKPLQPSASAMMGRQS